MLLMSFGLIKSPCPLAQGSLLSEQTVCENVVSHFQKAAWKLLAQYLIVTKEVIELRAHGVMLFLVLCTLATEVLVNLLGIGSIQLQLEDSVTV